ncbi:MAG TPA: endonuclease/exonuclease/phosphatase family protein [Gaiellaceae bacterium]|nr:endonuclease/exonuclease/phosphatase family protein [Gaiellaceae bacterium]
MRYPKVLLALAAAALLAVPAAQAGGRHHRHGHHGKRQITVMTQNLYLGTDLNPIFAAPSLPALFAAVGAGWTQVQANDFPARAQAIANEIAANRPDLVGLQEAELYRTDVPPDGPATPAETVAYDFIGLLVNALAQRGLQYEPVSTFSGTDVELPAFLPPTLDVRLTDRVTLLVRKGRHGHRLKLSNAQTGAYPTTLSIPTVAGPITATRGWVSVDVKTRGEKFRFITTHLEAYSPLVRNPQAAELLAGPASTSLPVVVVGDFNSGPGGDPTAYGILTGGGLSDAWPALLGPGLTCCHATDLHNPNATLTKRIDLVLTRGGFKTLSARVVGADPADRTASGLWPSDHAGLVARLRLP